MSIYKKQFQKFNALSAHSYNTNHEFDNLVYKKCLQQQDQLQMLLWQSDFCLDTLGNILNHLSFQQNLGCLSQQAKPMQKQRSLVWGTLQTNFNTVRSSVSKIVSCSRRRRLIGSSKGGDPTRRFQHSKIFSIENYIMFRKQMGENLQYFS